MLVTATRGLREIVSTTLLAVERVDSLKTNGGGRSVGNVNFSYRDFDLYGHLRPSALLSKCDDALDFYFRRQGGVALGIEWDFVLRRASLKINSVLDVGTSLYQFMAMTNLGETSFTVEYSFLDGSSTVARSSITYVSISVESMVKVATPTHIRSLIRDIG
jgi:acyl-CoA thioesterase FadM